MMGMKPSETGPAPTAPAYDLDVIDSVQAEPEEWPQDGDYMMPKWGVTVFFQHKDDAEAFIDAIPHDMANLDHDRPRLETTVATPEEAAMAGEA